MSELYIITGASKGLGNAMALDLAKEGRELLLIARDEKALQAVADDCSKKGARATILATDLGKKDAYETIKNYLEKYNGDETNTAVLINNASIISPITHLEQYTPEDITHLMSINLNASIWMAQLFCTFCKKFSIQNGKVLNISSGVSQTPLEGWGLYCISKAGMNALSTVVIEDTKNWKYPLQAVSVNPGPMDTDMQKEIRSSDEDKNPQKAKFDKMFNDGVLPDRFIVAGKILSLLKDNPFRNNEFVSFR